MSRVVNNSRYNAMDSDGALHDTMNMAAKETDTIEIKSAMYGLLFIMMSL